MKCEICKDKKRVPDYEAQKGNAETYDVLLYKDCPSCSQTPPEPPTSPQDAS